MSRAPSLRVERALLRDGVTLLAGMDEVGRGSLSGPVSVGVVCIDLSVKSAPAGLRDSKLLTPAARERLVPRVRRWALSYAVAHASAAEIDAYGIIRALRLAGERALAALPARPDLVLLDGNHDWLTPKPLQGELFEVAEPPPSGLAVTPPVITRIKADMSCSSVAGASVLAKTERDGLMCALAQRFPQYGWDVNKGYAAPEHRAALLAHGPCEEHRRSWNLITRSADGDGVPDDDAVLEDEAIA